MRGERKLKWQREGATCALDHALAVLQLASSFGAGLGEVERSLRMRETAAAFYCRLRSAQEGTQEAGETGLRTERPPEPCRVWMPQGGMRASEG